MNLNKQQLILLGKNHPHRTHERRTNLTVLIGAVFLVCVVTAIGTGNPSRKKFSENFVKII